jgi:hypothetical protein
VASYVTFAAGRVQTIHHPPQHITGCAHDPAGGDPIIQPDPGAIIPEPSVVMMISIMRLKTTDANMIGGL